MNTFTVVPIVDKVCFSRALTAVRGGKGETFERFKGGYEIAGSVPRWLSHLLCGFGISSQPQFTHTNLRSSKNSSHL